MKQKKVFSVIIYTAIIFAGMLLYCFINGFALNDIGLYSLFLGDFSIGICSRLLVGSVISIFKGGVTMPQKGVKIVVQNRKARHDYFVLETWEAGLELKGTEVKSIRLGQCNLKDSYALVKEGELLLQGMHISPYEQGNIFNHDPFRTRKLLAHKREITKLYGKQQADGYSLIPLSVYFKDGKVKVELALAKGKKLYDKRHDIAEKDADREMDRRMKDYKVR